MRTESHGNRNRNERGEDSGREEAHSARSRGEISRHGERWRRPARRPAGKEKGAQKKAWGWFGGLVRGCGASNLRGRSDGEGSREIRVAARFGSGRQEYDSAAVPWRSTGRRCSNRAERNVGECATGSANGNRSGWLRPV